MIAPTLSRQIHDAALLDRARAPRVHPADPLWLIIVSGIAWSFLMAVLLFIYIAIGG